MKVLHPTPDHPEGAYQVGRWVIDRQSVRDCVRLSLYISAIATLTYVQGYMAGREDGRSR